MCGVGSIGSGVTTLAGGCGSSNAVDATVSTTTAATQASLYAASATAGAQLIGASIPAAASGGGQIVSQGTASKSAWKAVTGKPSDSAKARAAYANVKALITKYPNEAALRAAGFVPNAGSNGTHWRVPGETKYADGTVFVGGLVTKNGITTGAQMDSKARWEGDSIPTGWDGVQWHYHDDGSAGWMFHIDATKPIDEAFTQNDAVGGHAH